MRVICLLCGLAAAGLTTAAKLPVFLWGSTDFFRPAHDGDLRRVSYQGEDMSMLHTAVNSLLGGVGADAQPESMQHMFKQTERPHLTVLFHGSEGTGLPIGKHPQLHATLQAAPASVSLPYVRQGDGGDLRTQLLAHAKAATSDDAELHILGDCGGDTVSSGSLGTTPELRKDRRAVVVVCPTTAEDGSAQMAALERLSDAARQTGLTNLFLFVADPRQKTGASDSGGRSLLAKDAEVGAQEQAADGVSAPAPSSGKGFVCDKKCRTQVNQLEAFILLATLLAALGMGVCCMGILDGPTRFESLKDD